MKNTTWWLHCYSITPTLRVLWVKLVIHFCTKLWGKHLQPVGHETVPLNAFQLILCHSSYFISSGVIVFQVFSYVNPQFVDFFGQYTGFPHVFCRSSFQHSFKHVSSNFGVKHQVYFWQNGLKNSGSNPYKPHGHAPPESPIMAPDCAPMWVIGFVNPGKFTGHHWFKMV